MSVGRQERSMQTGRALTLTSVFAVMATLTQPRGIRPVVFAQTVAAKGSSTDVSNSKAEFEVVSIRPSSDDEQLRFDATGDGYSARHTPLVWIVFEAFSTEPEAFWREDQIRTAPAWLFKDAYDIEARVDDPTANRFKTLNDKEKMNILRPMLQTLLKERCGLMLHTEEHDAPAYALIIKSRKPKLTPSSEGDKQAAGGLAIGDGGFMRPSAGENGAPELRFTHTSMGKFAEVLSGLGTVADVPIIDRTGLSGSYDFVLEKTEASNAGEGLKAPSPPTNWDVGTLGLGLEKIVHKRPFLYVDKVNRPTSN